MVEEAKIQPPAELGRITFAGAEVGPPAPRIIGQSDRLYIRSRCSVASVVVTVRGRLLTAPNILAPFDYRHTPNSDRSAAISAFELTAGYLLGLQVFVSTGTVRRGQCYVDVGLLRGLAAGDNIVEPLLAGYATIGGALGWPGGRILSSIEGPGALRSITGTDPAAGVEISETVPTNARWRIRSVYFVLVTGAAVANRQVHVLLDDGASVILRGPSASVQAANLTHGYSVADHARWSNLTALVHFIPLPIGITLSQGYRMRTATDNLQAADDFGSPKMFIEEWIEE